MASIFSEKKTETDSSDNHLRYEKALSLLSRRLLAHFHNSEKTLNEVLEILLNVAKCSRVYIFENFIDPKDGPCCQQIAEACATGVLPEINNPVLCHLPYANGYQRWLDHFNNGLLIYGAVQNFPESEKNALQAQGILSLIVLPIFCAKTLYGFIGFDDVQTERHWKNDDVELLRTAAEMIGAYFSQIKITSELKIQKEQYQEIFNAVTDALLVVNNKNIIIEANKQAGRLFAYQHQNLIGLSLEKIIPHHSYSAHQGILNITSDPNKPIAAENPLYIGETISINSKQQQLPTEIRISSCNYQHQQHLLFVIHDLSKRKNAEREKKELQGRLELSKKSEALGHLLGGVVHDLSNVLSSVVGFPELLIRNLDPDDPMRKPLEMMKESGAKAASIMHDLLTLARRGVIKFQPLSLNQLIDNYLTSPEHKALVDLHPQIKIVFQPQPIPEIMGACTHLNKMIMNLISNACEAITGEGLVTISTEFCHSNQRSNKRKHRRQNKKYICLQVQDNGSGIKSDDLSRIFEPFFSNKPMGKSGTGLGMTIVSTTVKDHKGHLDIHTAPDCGSCFKLFFPPATNTQKPNITPNEQAPHVGHQEKILVIDSSFEQRNTLELMLSHLNYQVSCAATAQEALELFQQNNFDLIIFDAGYQQNTNHLETFQSLQKLKPAQKAIAMTNSHCAETLTNAQKAGVEHCLIKPFNLESLCTTLERCFS